MTAYALGTGASAPAGYPLPSGTSPEALLPAWSAAWRSALGPRFSGLVGRLRDTFGSLDVFESILEKLARFGHNCKFP
jgi:hypothetical protein